MTISALKQAGLHAALHQLQSERMVVPVPSQSPNQMVPFSILNLKNKNKKTCSEIYLFSWEIG